MSGEGSQQGTTALFYEDSGKPERTAGMWLAPELASVNQWSSRSNGVMRSDRLAEKNQTGGGIQDGLQPQLARPPEIPARTELQ